MKTSEWVFSRMNGPAFCRYCGVSARSPDYVTPYCPYCGRFMTNYEEQKCSGYVHNYYDGQPHCMGTKEIEECSCGGDMRKCNFYPELRNKYGK